MLSSFSLLLLCFVFRVCIYCYHVNAGDTAIFTSLDGSLGEGVQSVAHASQRHLLQHKSCRVSEDRRYDEGIVCEAKLRRLQVWSGDQGALKLRGPGGGVCTMRYLSGRTHITRRKKIKGALQGRGRVGPQHVARVSDLVKSFGVRCMTGTDRKQGYGCPVLAGEQYSLDLDVDFHANAKLNKVFMFLCLFRSLVSPLSLSPLSFAHLQSARVCLCCSTGDTRVLRSHFRQCFRSDGLTPAATERAAV